MQVHRYFTSVYCGQHDMDPRVKPSKPLSSAMSMRRMRWYAHAANWRHVAAIFEKYSLSVPRSSQFSRHYDDFVRIVVAMNSEQAAAALQLQMQMQQLAGAIQFQKQQQQQQQQIQALQVPPPFPLAPPGSFHGKCELTISWHRLSSSSSSFCSSYKARWHTSSSSSSS